MTTLEAIGFTIVGGTSVLLTCVVCFGIAVRKQSFFVAPRCTARPPDTIYNHKPKDSCQKRGNAFLGWIPWTLSLSYDTMLRGIPGTGTRKNGMGGSLLKLNLDSIILLRYHALCLRISILATLLCIIIILPINLSARCYNLDESDQDSASYDPSCFSADYQKVTNYEKTTLANIPPLGQENPSSGQGGVWTLVEAKNTIWSSDYSSLLIRMYVIVLCSWIVTIYTCRLVAFEWVDALALRRVYYLEADHWNNRKDELEETLLKDEDDDDDDETPDSLEKRRDVNKFKPSDRRNPWIPHPEQRDTVPNVELYSVLVGGLPSLPSQVLDESDVEAAVGYSRKQSIDWQLAVATTFFDHCVPNQPGYSSSVAAITILPDAPELAKAWRKWYGAAAALRRLRYIRRIVADRRHFDIVDDEDEEDWDEHMKKKSNVEIKQGDGNVLPRTMNGGRANMGDLEDLDRSWVPNKEAQHNSQNSAGNSFGSVSPKNQQNSVSDSLESLSDSRRVEWDLKPTQDANNRLAHPSHIADAQKRLQYYRDVLGTTDDEEVETHLFHALHYGPEQTAVYSREMAQGAATCCPNGMCNQERLARARIDELLIMEQDALARVHAANIALQFAQARAAVSVIESNNSHLQLPKKKASEIEKELEAGTNPDDILSPFAVNSEHNTTNGEFSDESRQAEEKKGKQNKFKRSKNNNSFDAFVLPGELDMEAQLIARYNLKTSTNHPSNMGDSGTSGMHSSIPQVSPRNLPYEQRQRTRNAPSSILAPPPPPDGVGDGADGPTPTVSNFRKMDSFVKNEPKKQTTDKKRGKGGLGAISEQQRSSQESLNIDQVHPLLVERNDRATAQDHRQDLQRTSTASFEQLSSSMGHLTQGRPPIRPAMRGIASHRKLKSVQNLMGTSAMGLGLTADGKFRMKYEDDDDDDSARQTQHLLPPQYQISPRSTRGLENLTEGDEESTGAFDFKPVTDSMSTVGASRRRLNTDNTFGSNATPSKQWEKVQRIIHDDETHVGIDNERRKTHSGVWKKPSMKMFRHMILETTVKVKKWALSKTVDIVDELARDSTYAVVTFTSRQAAVAARHCLADGRGASRWKSIQHIPIPPLADAAAFDLKTCRGCCRPITLSVNEKQKSARKWIARLLLATIYLFYSIPISIATSLADPTKLNEIIPKLDELRADSVFFNELLTGIVPALLYTLFFALCPILFKAIANFGSNSTSVYFAEHHALQYYWWFMVVIAFSGSSLSVMALNAFNEGQIIDEASNVLTTIASTIPTQVSSTWINWIIVRTTMTLPLQYLLQVNTFLFHWLGWNCCSRCVMGGGPGGPVPYRIYIDSGVVLLCVLALAPASPIVAPCATFYYFLCSPLWRRNCIFVYRPKYDAGGIRWPFLSDIIISSMIVGQILLTTMMALKEAVGPGIMAALPIIPTIMFRLSSRKRYLRPFLDAALLQTSLLDGWDNESPTSMDTREEYRRFLVDAHKAAYIPVCIAGGATSVLTAEPAVVVPQEIDQEFYEDEEYEDEMEDSTHGERESLESPSTQFMRANVQASMQANVQFGASLRRLGSRGRSGTLDGSGNMSIGTYENN